MTKQNNKRYLIEGMMIVFSVMLALALDSWQQQLKTEKAVKLALQEIFLEVSTFVELEPTIDLNTQILASLDSAIYKHRKDPDSFNESIGFARPEKRNLSWLTARENGISVEFEPEIFKDLAEVYIEFERLESILNYNREFGLKSDPNMHRYTSAQHLQKQLSLTIFRSKELMKKSQALLEKYKDSKFFPKEKK